MIASRPTKAPRPTTCQTKNKVGAAMTHYRDVEGTFQKQKIKGLTRNRTGVAGMLLR
jgi:hypothetical protein